MPVSKTAYAPFINAPPLPTFAPPAPPASSGSVFVAGLGGAAPYRAPSAPNYTRGVEGLVGAQASGFAPSLQIANFGASPLGAADSATFGTPQTQNAPVIPGGLALSPGFLLGAAIVGLGIYLVLR